MNFWNNYQFLCIKNGLSVYDVARKCGIKGTGTVSYWRQGSVPKPDTLNKIAQYFSVSPSDLTDIDLSALETLSSSNAADDPLYAAILKLSPQKRALAMAFIAGLNANSDKPM